MTLLAFGAGLSQVITVVAAPVLTRLYDAAAFGTLAVVMGLANVVGSAATGNYEMVSVLAKDDREAANGAVLAAVLTVLASLLAFLAIVPLRHWWSQLIGNADAAPLLIWAPIAICSQGLYSTLTYWSTRWQRFRPISASQVTGAASTVVLQAAAGLAGAGGHGLAMGKIGGMAIMTIALALQSHREARAFHRDISWRQLGCVARTYVNFARYDAPRCLVFTIADSAPAYLLTAQFGPAAAGFFALSFSMLRLPSAVLGEAVRKVFVQRVMELNNAGGSPLLLLLKTTVGLAAIAAIPVIVIIAAGPQLFAVVFGGAWQRAGIYAQWLAVIWASNFLNIPSVMMVPFVKRQRFYLFFEIVTLAPRLASIPIAARWGSDLGAVAAYTVVGVLLNVGLVCYVFVETGRRCWGAAA